MLDLLCPIDNGIQIVKNLNLNKTLNEKFSDISSINFDKKEGKTFLLSDDNPGYFIKISDDISNLINQYQVDSVVLESEKKIFNNSQKNNRFDAESFFLDSDYMYIISENFSGENSAIIKYNFKKDFFHSSIILDKKDEKFHTISNLNNNDLIIFAKSYIQNINSNFLVKYKIFTKNLKYKSSGFIETNGKLTEFHKLEDKNIFLSLTDNEKYYSVGIYIMNESKDKSNLFSRLINLKIPIKYSKYNSLQGISFGPDSDDNYFTIMVVNDDNKKLKNKRNKNLKFYLSNLKEKLLKIPETNLMIFRINKDLDCYS